MSSPEQDFKLLFLFFPVKELSWYLEFEANSVPYMELVVYLRKE